MSGSDQDRATRFYEIVVERTIAEFLKQPSDIRRGILAALVMSHMAEHFYEARKPINGAESVQAFRQALRDENNAFRLIADVADATKHVSRSKHRGRSRLGFDDVAAESIHLGNLRAGWPIWGVQVMVKDGTAVWLLSQLITAVDEMWKKKLGRGRA